MNIEKRLKDAAVSPVVGVLLMLVITIIIAAVVSGFAGGLVENKAKTPQASFRVDITGDQCGITETYVMFIRHLSGDPIDTRRTELITSWMTQADTGTIHKDDLHYARTLPVIDTDTFNTGGFHQPYLTPDKTPPGFPESWGQYIMRAGDVAKVENSATYHIDPSMPVILEFNKIGKSEYITVRLVDSVTGGLIYEKDIYPSFRVNCKD